MSTRTLLLILTTVAAVLAAVLIVALLVDEGRDKSVAGEEHVVTRAAGSVLPDAAASATEPLSAAPVVVDVGGSDAGEDADLLADVTFPLGEMRGKLVDAAGRPVPGARVSLTVQSDAWEPRRDEDETRTAMSNARSGSDGTFTLPVRTGARHLLVAGGEDWPATYIEDVTVGDDLVVQLHDAWVLEGTVVDDETGTLVPDAWVLCINDGHDIIVQSDTEGRFSIAPVAENDLFLGAWAPGYSIAMVGDVSAALGATELRLPAGVELSGQLLDGETERPLEGGLVVFELSANVPLLTEAGALNWVERTVHTREIPVGPDGRFDLGVCPRMGFVLEATSAGYVPRRSERYKDRVAPADGNIVLSLQLADGWSGVVVAAEGGAPIPGARVTALGLSDGVGQPRIGQLIMGQPIDVAVTDAQGRFVVPNAGWNGERPVHLLAVDLEGRSGRAVVRGDMDDYRLEVVEPWHATVRVVSGGEPVSGAVVAVPANLPTRSERDIARLLSRTLPVVSSARLVRTGADGTARIEVPLDGPHQTTVTLYARHADIESLPRVVDLLTEPSGSEIVLDLAGGVTQTGLVIDTYGQAVPGALVRMADGPVGHTGPDGRFSLSPAISDEWTVLWAQADGYHKTKLDLVPGGDVTLVLEPIVRWSGRVIDATTGLPIERFSGSLGREKQLHGELVDERLSVRIERVSGSPGEFTIELPRAGRYSVSFRARDYVAAKSVQFDFNGTTPPPYQEISLSPAAILLARVIDGRGDPVVGLRVAATPVDANGRGSIKRLRLSSTNSEGEARLHLGEGGTFRLTAGHNTGRLLDRDVRVYPGDPTEVLVTLPPTGDLEVFVTREDGRPATRATVHVRGARKPNGKPKDGTWHYSRRVRTSVTSGLALLEGLPPGEYEATVRRRGYQRTTLNVTVPSDRTVRVNVQLEQRPAPQPGGQSSDQRLIQRLRALGYIGR